MAESTPWSIIVVPLSDSFRLAVGDLAAELCAEIREWSPQHGTPLPQGAGVVVLLAGGAEPAALELLNELSGSSASLYVVGALADHRIGVTAARRGARDYFALPDDLDLLRRSLEREAAAVRGRTAASEFAAVERRTSGFEAIVGRSPVLQQILGQAARVAVHRDVTVLIQGETGTGKEVLARAIHYHSPRAAEPFVEINCAAIPANLLESELFGHERGAFTGATSAKPGLFEMAHGGTVFLDEVGHLPLDLQPKLLRALENRSIRRVGGQVTRQVDVRVIAATHVDLAGAVQRGEFREDLFYRINVVALTLPPLRHRDDDVELLAETFLARLATSYGLAVPPLLAEVRAVLRRHSWPGNVRELRNAVERGLVLSPPGTLATDVLGLTRGDLPRAEPGMLPFPCDLQTLIRAAAQAAVELAGGNKSEAARQLAISRPRLQRLLDGLPEE